MNLGLRARKSTYPRRKSSYSGVPFRDSFTESSLLLFELLDVVSERLHFSRIDAIILWILRQPQKSADEAAHLA